MSDIMIIIASLEWMILGILLFYKVKKMNKRLDDLIVETREMLKNETD